MARRSTRDRLIAAATAAFAAHGFEGTTVDRIAANARVNKAMLYYHFPGKAALYREILRQVFADVADAVEPIAAASEPADARLRAFIETLANRAMGSQDFRGLWLREMAEGGRHLDAGVVAQLGRVLATIGTILADGVAEGRFRQAHPMMTHLGIVSPLLVFAATSGARKRFGRRLPPAGSELDWPSAVRQVQDATLAALRPDTPRVRARARRVPRRSAS